MSLKSAGLVLALVPHMNAETPKPPVAPRIEHREVRHGETVIDPYHWLREKSNPKVIEYLKAENAYTEAMTREMQPFADALYKEILGHIKQTDLSVPVKKGAYTYYSRTEEGKQYSIQCRRGVGEGAAEEVLLDLNALAEGKAFVGLGEFEVSEDARRLAFSTDYSGFRQYTLYVKDLATGETSAGLAERVTSVAWAADNKTLFLVTEDEVTKRSNQLWRLELGGKPELLYEEKDELYSIGVDKTRDGKYILLEIGSTDTTEYRYVKAEEPQGALRVFLPREKKHRYYVDHREGLFYIRTNKDAKNFRIVTAAVEDPRPENWKSYVEHRPEVLVTGIDLFRDFAVVMEKSGGLARFEVRDFRNGKRARVTFPEPVYTARGSWLPEYESPVWRYSYESFTTPPSVYDYEVAGGGSKLLKRTEVPNYDPSLYASERLWAVARDGVRVPISIVYRKGFAKDGKAALYLYGYGSYGIPTNAGFSASRLALLDRGVAYAIAHIRGGNELGEPWREDGMLMKKKNTFFDFIDCAEHLIREKWTSKERLMISGGSAGGLLMGAVVNYRPDLFKAVHMAVPFVDVMNTMMDATLPLTVGEYLEWGNPNEKEAYDYMKSYSPYDNLEKRAYPAILVTTSLNDSQVMYWEPAKYVARLRTLKTDANPLLLRIKLDPAGHGGASGRYDKIKDTAWEYAWMLTQVGITK
jgi:oligopeptidase B